MVATAAAAGTAHAEVSGRRTCSDVLSARETGRFDLRNVEDVTEFTKRLRPGLPS
ncbi:hypothetical protein [Amycolatopsis sp. lyj-112]|uniref:hypothetical protein n=1 Tax=Amycolatopsis sp. lyj-112 TaxID=2789288 RepID=UPI003978AB8E